MSLINILILLTCIMIQRVRAQCPSPYSLEAGKCVFVNTSQSFTWCEANRQCASIGGELLNSYSPLQLLPNMSSLTCSCNLYFGVTDLADERNKNKSGWQLVNGRGILPLNDALWHTSDPNNRFDKQSCVGQFNNADRKLVDLTCSDLHGFVCEFATMETPGDEAAVWKQTPFKRTSYHSSTEYCYTDLTGILNERSCVFSAMRAGNSRQVLYNRKLRACRLLLFTDAQVEEEIETSADWVKFGMQ